MIVEVTYSEKDLRKRCYNCEYLKLEDESYDWNGICTCKENKVKHRNRSITDRACMFKKGKKEFKNLNFKR